MITIVANGKLCQLDEPTSVARFLGDNSIDFSHGGRDAQRFGAEAG